jgi:hypothetical protein
VLFFPVIKNMLDEAARKRMCEHVMEIWFEPEIRRRQEQGAAPKPFPLRAAQVILSVTNLENQFLDRRLAFPNPGLGTREGSVDRCSASYS